MSAMTGDCEAALSRLEALLLEERVAITSMDAVAVEAASFEKERLFSVLMRADGTERRAHGARLRKVVVDVRRNGVLLAHARDCLRDVLLAVHGPALELHTDPSRPTIRPGASISLTG